MTDMLVNLYAEREADRRVELAANGVVFNRALALDKQAITGFVKRHFSDTSSGWADECSVALGRQPSGCFVAVYDGEPVGFACYDATAKGMVGPIGVAESQRGKGIATVLLNLCFEAMKADGYAYAVIGWVSSEDFYRKCCGAIAIPGSVPGVYSRMLRNESSVSN